VTLFELSEESKDVAVKVYSYFLPILESFTGLISIYGKDILILYEVYSWNKYNV
jgi:hypothetical protein